jgi:hypothetical protein
MKIACRCARLAIRYVSTEGRHHKRRRFDYWQGQQSLTDAWARGVYPPAWASFAPADTQKRTPATHRMQEGSEPTTLRGDERFSDLPEAFRWYRFPLFIRVD